MTTRRAGALLALLAGSVAALVLGELVLRVLRPAVLAVPASESAEFFAFDAELGWRNRAGGRGRMIFLPDFDHEIRINVAGLRDRDFDAGRASGKRRILCLGDSFTWGMGVEAGETWPKVLERALPGAEALNAGVNGWTTSQELLWLRREGLAYRPDAVVVAFYVNDFFENGEGSSGFYARPLFLLDGGRLLLTNVPVSQPEAARVRVRTAWLQNHSWLFRLAASGLDWFRRGFLERADLSPLPRGGPAPPAPVPATGGPPARDVTQALLEEIGRTCHASGAAFAVLLVPAKTQVRPASSTPLRTASDFAAYDAARAICRDLGIPAADPLDDLAAAEARGTPVYHRMDMHLNAAGHRIAGERLARLLGPLLPAAPVSPASGSRSGR
jgi:lysophospholipase L1-like esterase